MKVVETPIKGIKLLDIDCYRDNRGFFLESYQAEKYHAVGIQESFVQDNHSRSKKGVLRGLHFQIQRPQSQIVTVMRGEIYDVAVDIRPASPTFGRWHGVVLSDEGIRQIYVTEGFAHGFCVLSEWADLHYKVSRFYDADDEGGLLWNDPDLAISWPNITPIIKQRDAEFPQLSGLTGEQFPNVSK